jgi:hypothetical protein
MQPGVARPQRMCQHPRLALIPPEGALVSLPLARKKEPEGICRFQGARAGRTQLMADHHLRRARKRQGHVVERIKRMITVADLDIDCASRAVVGVPAGLDRESARVDSLSLVAHIV